MSSVTRFLRQIPVSTTYYQVPSTVTAATTSFPFYEFVPTAANYVGNYPPGSMVQITSANTPAVATAIQNAVSNAGTSTALVLRDMGKTIFAPNAAGTSFGYYRQVQLLNPSAISSTQGFIGGPLGQTFGVLGGQNSPDANTDYFTLYVPVTVGGILGAGTTTFVPIAGGQM
jgi:hypothetical protein